MSHDLTESSVLVYLIALSRFRCQKCPSTCRAGRVSHSPTAEGPREQHPALALKLLPQGTGLVLRYVVGEGGEICLTLFLQMGKLYQRD